MATYEHLEADLEKARDAMHDKRNDKTIAAYQKASDAFAKARQEMRSGRESTEAAEGDAVAEPTPVNGGVGVNK